MSYPFFMLIEEKYFAQDKNYLLKSVQAFSKENLLNEWLQQILHSYTLLHNPMGLEDDFFIALKERISRGKELLENNYDIVAAIYRHEHADNQLEIMWDGRTHMEAYDSDWKSMYAKWVGELSLNKDIQRSVIKFAVSGQGVNHTFLKQSIRRAILAHFGLRMRAHTLYSVSA